MAFVAYKVRQNPEFKNFGTSAAESETSTFQAQNVLEAGAGTKAPEARSLTADASLVSLYGSIRSTNNDADNSIPICRLPAWKRLCNTIGLPISESLEAFLTAHPVIFWGTILLTCMFFTLLMVYLGRTDLLLTLWYRTLCWLGFISCEL